MKLDIIEKNIEYADVFEVYKSIIENNTQALLMESRTKNLAYGKQSIIATGLALKISGKNDYFKIEALNEQGVNLLKEFSKEDFQFASECRQKSDCLEGCVSKIYLPGATEDERIKLSGQARFLKSVMKKFESDNEYAGLYGAVAYDFARNFEDIGEIHEKEEGNDYTLFLPAEIYVFDDIKEKAIKHELQIRGSKIPFKENASSPTYGSGKTELELCLTDKEYIEKVSFLVDEIKKGRFMQCVLSRSVSMRLVEPILHSYSKIRERNPSPYNFFFDLGDSEFLYGASPEIHAVVEDGNLTIRPLAGTIRRSSNAYDDAMRRIRLLTDKKEISEHSMLVDLARNEVYRLCEPESVKVEDMYTIEAYPNLYHLASGVKGRLKEGFDSIDVLLTTIPAGTLSGAPKKEAMKAIEQLETHRRGYYGGLVGYLSFNDNMNTGITIRSVHVKNNNSLVQSGAGIVKNSDPYKELEEIILKSSKQLEAIGGRLK